MRRVVKRQHMQVRAIEVRPGDFVKGPDQSWIEVLHARPVPEHHAVELTLNLEVKRAPSRRGWLSRLLSPTPPTTISLYTSHVDSSAVLDITVLRDIAIDDEEVL